MNKSEYEEVFLSSNTVSTSYQTPNSGSSYSRENKKNKNKGNNSKSKEQGAATYEEMMMESTS